MHKSPHKILRVREREGDISSENQSILTKIREIRVDQAEKTDNLILEVKLTWKAVITHWE